MTLTMNKFNVLNEEEVDITIETDNQLRNQKKKLKRKNKQYEFNPSESLKIEIDRLQIIITEYQDRKNKIIYKKKKKQSIMNDDLKFLNDTLKTAKYMNHKIKMRNEQLTKLKKKQNPKWSLKNHLLFPLHDRLCIQTILLCQLREDCIISYLPKEVIINILINFSWDDFKIQ